MWRGAAGGALLGSQCVCVCVCVSGNSLEMTEILRWEGQRLSTEPQLSGNWQGRQTAGRCLKRLRLSVMVCYPGICTTPPPTPTSLSLSLSPSLAAALPDSGEA